MTDEAARVRELVQATIDGFNRGDVDAYMAMVDDRSLVRNAGSGTFATGEQMRALAPMVIGAMKRFDVHYEGTEVLGETAVLWGTFENVLRADGDTDGPVVRGQFTIACARVDGEWKVACSHYSAT